jgi:hypothetical protein
MKISFLNSTLSCITKRIRFVTTMINKKIILGLFVISFLGACAPTTAILGPTFTFTSTGSALQTGLTYGSGKVIEKYTGKTPIENLQKMSLVEPEKEKNNIKKQTLESKDFIYLVDKRIKKASSILNLSN